MARTKIYFEDIHPSPLIESWLEFRRIPAALIGLWSLLVFLAFIILGAIIAPYDPLAQHADALLLPPSWSNAGDVHYILGTDDLGRDILSRIIHGCRLTFGSSLLVVAVSLMFGILIGSIAGTSSGVKSSILNHLFDALLSIPSLLLAIIIVAILGPGLINSMWAISLALAPQFIHVIHNLVREEFQKEYVVAAKLDGASSLTILIDSVFPNIMDRIVLHTTLALSIAVLDITALGFLGLGAPAGSPEWGSMLSGGLELAYAAPWTVALPGLMIFLVVATINMVGDGLRHALKARTHR